MGSACCVAAKDRNIVHGPNGGTWQRHARHSPSWSFRWDSRVSGEETHANWLHDGGVRNYRTEAESGTNVETAFASEEGSPLDSLRSNRKESPVPVDNLGMSKLQVADEAISKNPVEVKESAESPSVSHPSPVKFFPVTALSPSDRSSGSWSVPKYSKLMTTRRERRSFDSENSGFSIDKIDRSSCRSSDSPPLHPQTCGACAKLLSEKSSWGWSCQKIVSTKELAVVSILNCGHVYHAECLEHTTPEINKYDPSCPVCTYGEKKALKMCEKALKAELDLKARKRSNSSSLIKKTSFLGKFSLKRHFSFSLKSGKPLSKVRAGNYE